MSDLRGIRRTRRRARIACTPCRIKKTGCDGGRPSCATCTARGQSEQCIYQQNVRSNTQSAQNPLAATPAILLTGSSYAEPISANTIPETEVKSTQLYSDSSQRALDAAAANSVLEQEAEQQSTDERNATFGPSSNHFFIQQVAAAVINPAHEMVQQINGWLAVEQGLVPDAIGFPVLGGPGSGHDLDAISLPERTLADELLDAYWSNVHITFPILHKPSFIRTYDQLWQPSSSDRAMPKDRRSYATFHATLNTILALGCRYSHAISPEQRGSRASKFYTRSLQLVSVENLEIYTLEIVQLLLLRTLHLLHTSNSAGCWSMCGVAIRVAQGVGLHLAKPKDSNQLRREMERRVWYGLLVVDRFAGASFGWPILRFSANTVPLPDDIDEEYLSENGNGCQPENMPTRVSCFKEYAKLCVFICTDILESAYSHMEKNPRGVSHEAYSHYLREVPDLCSRLDDFLDDLPLFLRDQDVHLDQRQTDAYFRAQGQFLKERTSYIKLLLLRPCLMTSVREHMRQVDRIRDISVASLLRNAVRDVNLLCVTTAHSVLHDLHERTLVTGQICTWHSVRMSFGAVVVLVAASLVPDLDVDLSKTPASSSWAKALEILECHKLQDSAAQNAIDALWSYRSRFEAAARRGTSRNSVNSLDDPSTSLDQNIASALDETLLTGSIMDFGDMPMGGVDQSWWEQDNNRW